MVKRWLIFAACLVVLCLLSCGPQAKKAVTGGTPLHERHYGMPSVPPSLKDPSARAGYVVSHYWERFDFHDASCNGDSVYLEQAFVDYAAVLPLADSVLSAESIGRLVTSANGTCYLERIMELAKHYLGHPDSPVRNEWLYTVFLQRYSGLLSVGVAQRERARYMAGELSKNLPGRVAADFTYTDRQGHTGNLHAIKSEWLLLLFYDPDCDNCHRLLGEASRAAFLTDNPRLKVLAVYAGDDTGAWKERRQPVAGSWMDAQSREIGRRQLYYIPATPAFYLLDSNKRVVLKDASIGQLRELLEQ